MPPTRRATARPSDFYKDGTSTKLHLPVTVALDSPQTVQVNLQGTSQLVIGCTAASADGSYGDDIDVVIGDATLSRLRLAGVYTASCAGTNSAMAPPRRPGCRREPTSWRRER